MSRNLTSFVFRDWQSRKFVKVSTGLTNFVSTFLRKKKFPSQSSLAHKLMCSGFFYLPKVSERLPQPGCISIRLMYSGFFYLPPFKMIFNIKERKKAKRNCQQHPVFPGGHPSKYWLGSTLLNFSDRTRTGVFSVIWPLAKEGVKIRLFELTNCLANWNSTSSNSSYEFRKMPTDSSSEVQH